MKARDSQTQPNATLQQVWSSAEALPDPSGQPRLLASGDKNTKAPVFFDRDFLSVWLVEHYWKDVTHIEFLGWSPDFTIQYIYFSHLQLLPQRFQVPRRAAWNPGLLYDYSNPKEKCFVCGQHTCTEENHQCWRRISANLLPTSRAERCAARALEAFGQDSGPGPGGAGAASHFQVWSCD